jgi:hypothetical protein
MASIRFENDCAFYDAHDFENGIFTEIPITKLTKGMMIRVRGTEGEFQVLGRFIERGKNYVECVYISDEFFKVQHDGQTFGVEAICHANAGFPGEYFVNETKLFFNKRSGEYVTRTFGRWIPQLECVRV